MQLDDKGKDLMCKMLIYDPDKRISVADCLAHPYFDDLKVQMG